VSHGTEKNGKPILTSSESTGQDQHQVWHGGGLDGYSSQHQLPGVDCCHRPRLWKDVCQQIVFMPVEFLHDGSARFTGSKKPTLLDFRVRFSATLIY